MKRKPIGNRPDPDTLPREPPEDTPDLLLALARRRCPRCNNYLFEEVGRLYCLICSWEWSVERR